MGVFGGGLQRSDRIVEQKETKGTKRGGKLNRRKQRKRRAKKRERKGRKEKVGFLVEMGIVTTLI
jgi:hypothetical protein